MTILPFPGAMSSEFRHTHRARLLDVAPATEAAWRSAIDADPHAVPEQSPEWVRAIVASTGGRDISRAYHFGDGTTAVLPLVQTGRTRLAGAWSMPPAWGVGGIVGPDIDTDKIVHVADDLRRMRHLRVMVRIDVRHREHWDAAVVPGDVLVPRRSHVIDLHDDVEQHFAALSKRTRTKIRKCARDGVTIEVDRTGALLATHHELFLTSVARWAEHQHEPLALARFRARRRDPIEKLQAMQRALGDRFLTLVASVDGRPAASVIILLGATARYTRGAMDIDLASRSNANYGLQWRAIEEAYEYGSTRYHMGESGSSAGIATFKERMGARPTDHHEYRFERLPVTRTGDLARTAVKRMIGFRD